MSEVLPTVKVKPWGAGQGDFVEINASDFDPAKHERSDFVPPLPAFIPPPPPAPPRHPLDGLPEDWRTSKRVNRRSLAAAVSDGRTPENDKQAAEMIEAAIAARAAK